MSNLKLVMTTINPPRDRVYEWIDFGYELVVIGDSKTDDSKWKSIKSKSLTYLSFDDCRKQWPKLSALIGEKTYARKNFGYLYAAESESDYIFETDDDTFARIEVGELVSFYQNCDWKKVRPSSNKIGQSVFNPFEFFAPGYHAWPRGIPLLKVRTPDEVSYQSISCRSLEETIKENKIGVIQSLVNLDPDVDSIYRLTSPSPIVDLPISREVLLLDKVLAPGNTQSTFWCDKSSFVWTYIPRSVSIRFCDILKMYLAQWRTKMAYSGFLTEQFRNPHDLMQDFVLEYEMFTKLDKLISHMDESCPDSLVGAYSLLAKWGIVDSSELQIVEAYQLEFDKL